MDQKVVICDEYFRQEPDAVKNLRLSRPWTMDSQYFNKCHLNITAASKMLKHALQGVADGKSRGGLSVEVMGLLIGKPMNGQVVVTDVIQLPVEGMENRVEAPAEVQILMSQMVDILELKRDERILGWYHSHPFELESYSHCHMSSTDVTTQTSFQNAIPWWTALVIDPIRSLTEKRFEIGAYRCYQPGFFQDDGIAPDGVIWSNISNLKRRWGVAPNRYYTMDLSYWMSSHAARISNRTGTYTNWTRPLLENAFKDFLRYQTDLALVNQGLSVLNRQLDLQSSDHDLSGAIVTESLTSLHNAECRCGPLGHSRLLQLVLGVKMDKDDIPDSSSSSSSSSLSSSSTTTATTPTTTTTTAISIPLTTQQSISPTENTTMNDLP